MNYQHFLQAKLQELKAEQRYRTFIPLLRHCGNFPLATDCSQLSHPPVVVWCSNDYLGMGQHRNVLQAMHEAIDHYGAGAGGTRNISGTSRLHKELESELASLHQKEAALLFTSGYIANETTLSTLAQHLPGCVVFSDAHNHASIIQGVRMGRVAKHIFQHNDPADLRQYLARYPIEVPKIVVFESIYSMEGDIAPTDALCQVAQDYNALTYVDEVHAVGVYGTGGAGLANEQGCAAKVDIIQGTLGKAFGAIGGYIAANSTLIDFVRSYAPGFIFTTALPPAILAGALASVRTLRSTAFLKAQLNERVIYLRQKLAAANIPFYRSQGHITPILLKDPQLCNDIALRLRQQGHYVQPINYPTVPRGTERFRITVTPYHSNKMIEDFVACLKQAFQLSC